MVIPNQIFTYFALDKVYRQPLTGIVFGIKPSIIIWYKRYNQNLVPFWIFTVQRQQKRNTDDDDDEDDDEEDDDDDGGDDAAAAGAGGGYGGVVVGGDDDNDDDGWFPTICGDSMQRCVWIQLGFVRVSSFLLAVNPIIYPSISPSQLYIPYPW